MAFFGQDGMRRDEERLRRQQEYANELKMQMEQDRRRKEADMVTDDPTAVRASRPPLAAAQPRGRRQNTPPEMSDQHGGPIPRTRSAESFRLPALDRRHVAPEDYRERPVSREKDKLFQTSMKEASRVDEARRMATDSQAQIRLLEERIMAENKGRFQLEEIVKTQLMENSIMMTEMHRRMDVLETTVQSDSSRIQQVIEKINQMTRQAEEQAQIYEQRSVTELAKLQADIHNMEQQRREEDSQRFGALAEEQRKLQGFLELAQKEAAHFQLESRNKMHDVEGVLKSLSGVDERVMDKVTDKVLKLLNSADERFKDVEQVVTVLKNQLLSEEEARQAHMKRLANDFQEILQEKEADIINRISQGTISMQEQQMKSLMESRHKEFVAHRERDLAEKKALQTRLDKLDTALVDSHKSMQTALDNERAVAEGIRQALEQQIGVVTAALSEEEETRTKQDAQTRQDFLDGMKTVSKSFTLVEQDVGTTREALEQSLKAEVKSRIQGEQELKLKIEYIGGHATSHIESIEKDVQELVENQRAIIADVVQEERKTIDEQYARSYADLAVQLKQQKKKLKETAADLEAKIEEVDSQRDADRLEASRIQAETDAILQTHTTKIGSIAANQEEAAAARQRLMDGYDTLKKTTEDLTAGLDELTTDLAEARAQVDQNRIAVETEAANVEALTAKADATHTELTTFKESVDDTTELHWNRLEDMQKNLSTIRSDVARDNKILTENVTEHLRAQQAAVSELKEQLGNDWDEYKKATNEIADDLRADVDSRYEELNEEFVRLTESTNAGVEAATTAVNEIRESHEQLGNDFDEFQQEITERADKLREDLDAYKTSNNKALAATAASADTAVKNEARARQEADNQAKTKIEGLQTAFEDAAKQQASSLIQISMDLKSDLAAHKQAMEEASSRLKEDVDGQLEEISEQNKTALDEISEQIEDVGKAHDDLAQEVADNKEAADVGIQAMEEENKRLEEQLQTMQKVTSATDKDLRKAMDELRSSTTNVIASVREVLETFKEETSEVQQATIQDIAQLREGLQVDVDKHTKLLGEQGEQLASLTGQIQAFDTTMNEYVSDLDAKLAEVKTSVNDVAEEFRSEVEAQQQAVDDNLETLQGQIDSLGEDFSADIDEVSAAIDTAKADLESTVQDLTTRFENYTAEASKATDKASQKVSKLETQVNEAQVVATATSQACLQLDKRLETAEGELESRAPKKDLEEARKELSNLQEKFISGNSSMNASIEAFTNASRDALDALQKEHRKELNELHEQSQSLKQGLVADLERLKATTETQDAKTREQLEALRSEDARVREELGKVRSELDQAVGTALNQLGSLEGRVSRAADHAQNSATTEELKEYYGRHASILEKIVLRCEALAKKQDEINSVLEAHPGDLRKGSRVSKDGLEDWQTEVGVYKAAVGEVKTEFEYFKTISEDNLALLRKRMDDIAKAVTTLEAVTPRQPHHDGQQEQQQQQSEPYMPTLISAELDSLRVAHAGFEKMVTDLTREHHNTMDELKGLDQIGKEQEALRTKVRDLSAALEELKGAQGSETAVEALRAELEDVRARAVAAEKLYDNLSKKQDELEDRLEDGNYPVAPTSARSTKSAADALKHAHREFEKQIALLNAKQTELASNLEDRISSGGDEKGMALATLAEQVSELERKVNDIVPDELLSGMEELKVQFKKLVDDTPLEFPDAKEVASLKEAVQTLEARVEELSTASQAKRGSVGENSGAGAGAGSEEMVILRQDLEALRAQVDDLASRDASGAGALAAGDDATRSVAIEELGDKVAALEKALEDDSLRRGSSGGSGAAVEELKAKIVEMEEALKEQQQEQKPSRRASGGSKTSKGEEGKDKENAELNEVWDKVEQVEAEMSERLDQLTERIEEVAEAGNGDLKGQVEDISGRVEKLEAAGIGGGAVGLAGGAEGGSDADLSKAQMSLQNYTAANDVALRTQRQLIDEMHGQLEALERKVEELEKREPTGKDTGAGVGDGSIPENEAEKVEARLKLLSQEIQMANDATDNLYDFMENNQKTTDQQLAEVKQLSAALEEKVEELLERVGDTEAWIRQADGEGDFPEGEDAPEGADVPKGEGEGEGEDVEDVPASESAEGDAEEEEEPPLEGEDAYVDAPLAEDPPSMNDEEMEESPDAPAE